MSATIRSLLLPLGSKGTQPPQMELLAAESCALHDNKEDTVGFWEFISMIRERDNVWQIEIETMSTLN